jgi:tetratricopeptide (TPR) repeat protein
MSSRLKTGLSAATLLALAFPAVAQEQLGGLGMIDPFGRGYLESGEPAMPTNMWKASRTEDLLPLMEDVRTRQLTPAERMLLRRVVLSPAARPEGENAEAVLAERARILYELGEAEAASDLLDRLDENPRGLNAAQLSVDLQLALGNEATACRSLTTETREGQFWARLRAVCAVLQNNAPAAELAVELAQAQGVDDPWFANAVFAASVDTPSDLPAQYDSGLNLALSAKLGLEPSEQGISVSRPDLAAAMATRTSLPLEVRIPAAGLAAEAGLLDGAAHRELYSELVAQEGYEPVRSIELGVAALDDPEETAAIKARSLDIALRASAGNPARFLAASRLFAEDLAVLERDVDTAPYAMSFARAEIALGRLEKAAAWLDRSPIIVPEPEPAPEETAEPVADSEAEASPEEGAEAETPLEVEAEAEPVSDEPAEGTEGEGDTESGEDAAAETEDPDAEPEAVEPPPEPQPEPETFESLYLKSVLVLAGHEKMRAERRAIAEALIDIAQSPAEQAHAARIFALWAARHVAPPAAARALMSGAETESGVRGDEWRMLAIRAAAEADAAGEVVVSTLGLTLGEPTDLAMPDTTVILDALTEIGAEDAAAVLALEATGYWRNPGN